MRRLLLTLLCPLAAVAADFPDLPPSAQVDKALRGHPAVRAAAAGLRGEEANRDRLVAGPHEFALRLSGQRRRELPVDLSYREREIGLERALRLPGKAAKDAEIGAAGVEQARFMLGDALHESARQLLAGWFAWQREVAAAREWQAQVEVLRALHDAAGKKVSAGDAARIELMQAEAQLAQAEARLEETAARRERAAIELTHQFPGIVLPADVTPRRPQVVDGSAEAWRERILAHNHELAVARSGAKRSRLAAQRLDAERLPDPTLGLKVASERDGQERIVGLQLTLPLPGEARAASARSGGAEAEAAGAREALALAKAETEARRTVSLAQSAYGQWQRFSAVAARMEDNARLLDKAWRLGEGLFAELQNARRQGIEARLAAMQAQLDANEARYRLLLDAHQLWDFDVHADEAPER